MKIAFIGQKGIPAHGGGVERHVEELGKRFVEHGHEVVVYVRSNYTDPKLRSYEGMKLVHLPTIHTKHLDASIHSFLASFHAVFTGADTIFYEAIGPGFFSIIARLLKPSTKIIVTNHGFDWKRAKWGWFAKWFLRLGERVSAYIADDVICVSPAMIDHYWRQYGIVAKHITNGISEQKSMLVEKVDEIDVVSGQYFLFMARIVPEKGLHYLIDAYRDVPTDFKLIIAGDSSASDDYLDYVKEKARNDERIIFVGNVTGDLWVRLFSNAYACIMPSEVEAASFSILEAMNFSQAVLTSDIPENVILVKKFGFTFETGNIKDLREKISYILNNPLEVKAKGVLARKYVLLEHNWDVVVEKFLQLQSIERISIDTDVQRHLDEGISEKKKSWGFRSLL